MTSERSYPFLSVSWGPVIPAGEAFCGIEATKGNNGYYLVSDGNTCRTARVNGHRRSLTCR